MDEPNNPPQMTEAEILAYEATYTNFEEKASRWFADQHISKAMYIYRSTIRRGYFYVAAIFVIGFFIGLRLEPTLPGDIRGTVIGFLAALITFLAINRIWTLWSGFADRQLNLINRVFQIDDGFHKVQELLPSLRHTIRTNPKQWRSLQRRFEYRNNYLEQRVARFEDAVEELKLIDPKIVGKGRFKEQNLNRRSS